MLRSRVMEIRFAYFECRCSLFRQFEAKLVDVVLLLYLLLVGMVAARVRKELQSCT